MNDPENHSTVAINGNDQDNKGNLISENPDEKTITGKTLNDPNQPIDSRTVLTENPSIANGESVVISPDEVASDIKTDKSTFADISLNLEELKKSEERKNNPKSVIEPGVDNLIVAEKNPSPIVTNGMTSTNSDPSKFISELDKKKEKEEVHSAYSKLEKENANKDLPNNGVSLGDKPELLEFLFTAL